MKQQVILSGKYQSVTQVLLLEECVAGITSQSALTTFSFSGLLRRDLPLALLSSVVTLMTTMTFLSIVIISHDHNILTFCCATLGQMLDSQASVYQLCVIICV